MTNYNSFCDDFYVDMYVSTRFDLPTERDILLTFFERITRQFPYMTTLARQAGGYNLEHNSDSGAKNKWVSVDTDRLGAGSVNPESLEEAFEMPKLVLDVMPYLLGIRSLDIDCIDLTFAMDFECSGNHNEIIAEAVLGNSPFAKILESSTAVINVAPTAIMAVSNDLDTRIRLTIDSRTDEDEIKKQNFDKNKPISLYMTARQYPKDGRKFEPEAAFDKLCMTAIDFMDEKVVPNLINPLANAIAHRR